MSSRSEPNALSIAKVPCSAKRPSVIAWPRSAIGAILPAPDVGAPTVAVVRRPSPISSWSFVRPRPVTSQASAIVQVRRCAKGMALGATTFGTKALGSIRTSFFCCRPCRMNVPLQLGPGPQPESPHASCQRKPTSRAARNCECCRMIACHRLQKVT